MSLKQSDRVRLWFLLLAFIMMWVAAFFYNETLDSFGIASSITAMFLFGCAMMKDGD